MATPGRLLDLMQQGHCSLDSIKVLVLDEADRMLDMGFFPAIRRILQKVPKARQTLMFSATMKPEIRELADSMLTDPVSITIEPKQKTTELVTQSVAIVPQKQKIRALIHLIDRLVPSRCIVFSRTKHGADRIVRQLTTAGLTAAAIHANKSQNKRLRILEQFRSSAPGARRHRHRCSRYRRRCRLTRVQLRYAHRRRNLRASHRPCWPPPVLPASLFRSAIPKNAACSAASKNLSASPSPHNHSKASISAPPPRLIKAPLLNLPVVPVDNVRHAVAIDPTQKTHNAAIPTPPKATQTHPNPASHVASRATKPAAVKNRSVVAAKVNAPVAKARLPDKIPANPTPKILQIVAQPKDAPAPGTLQLPKITRIRTHPACHQSRFR
ncbi:MAG UNVERIFIED_CONTAM: DEAD/DEAH box helicase [Planctomycetaceae bacterium]